VALTLMLQKPEASSTPLLLQDLRFATIGVIKGSQYLEYGLFVC
jgi:hypothetical protein